MYCKYYFDEMFLSIRVWFNFDALRHISLYLCHIFHIYLIFQV